MSKPDLRESLERDGFVLIPGLLSADQITHLREAARETVDFARSGKWPYVRTVPKQFPPWNSDDAEKGIWGVQYLMHPDLPTSSTFIPTYFSPALIAIVKELLQCDDSDLVLELYNILIRPDVDFQLRWHRDDIPASASAEEELRRLQEPAWHAQWNLALYDDASLIVVPGSHRRARTDKERVMDEYAEGVEGEISVHMKAGDVVFYDNNILHRGKYVSARERATLHGSMGHRKGSALRARNVLQHGLKDWVGKIDLSCLEGEERKRAEGMRERLLNLAAESGEVGYSLDG